MGEKLTCIEVLHQKQAIRDRVLELVGNQTGTEMEAKTGISHAHKYRWVSKVNYPGLEVLLRLSAVYDVSIDELMQGKRTE